MASKMLDADKENFPPVNGDAASAKRPLSSASTNSSPPTTSTKSALGPASLAFPAQDPDEDRDVLASDGKTLRSKRSVLFYPSASLAAKSNQQPFSRSAAKRESILALGSIGYLQHLYTKQGIANRNRPMTKGAMTLAIGPAGEAMVSNSAGNALDSGSDVSMHGRLASSQIAEEESEAYSPELPPSPKAGSYTRPKFLDLARPLEADTQALRALLVSDLQRLSKSWALSDWIRQEPEVARIQKVLSDSGPQLDSSSAETEPSPVDLLAIIDVTTKAIRSVRSYVLALPQRSKIPTTSPNEPNGRDRYKRQSSFSGVSRPGQIGVPVPTRTSEILHHDLSTDDPSRRDSMLPTPSPNPRSGRRFSNTQSVEDAEVLSTLRKAALEMLSALKDMEERNRVEILGSVGEETEPDVSVKAAKGYTSSMTSSGDPDESSISTFAETALRTGYLYRSDLQIPDLAAERTILQSYLKTVNMVLPASAASAASVQDNRRPSSSGMSGTPSSEEAMHSATDVTPSIRLDPAEDLLTTSSQHTWASAGLNTAQRVSGFMIDHCGAGIDQDFDRSRLDRLQNAKNDLRHLLPLLYDGYLLCRAFNEAVRRSDKPWGYISSREMHDLEAEEAALLHKEALRVKQAQEAEALNFQTRTNRRSASEGESGATDTEPQSRSIDQESSTSRPGWTFRRTENLRVWAAALKLRYHIQTTATRATPAKPATTGPTYGSLGMGKLALHGRRAASESYAATSSVQHGTSKTLDFDPAKVARKEDGWQEMMTKLLLAWIDAVAEEQSVGPSGI
ncbi:uncharacterized protein UTRI_01314_B [Ustilago trichophora]|uniref:Uncharacterized protein n=1 Tax=Ustilago trichophora TaxID=86804 RepID=A0A5C3DX39_9BASI|nr:uncharacterized protein UTRI_01314_B [Ustilago trichophora]